MLIALEPAGNLAGWAQRNEQAARRATMRSAERFAVVAKEAFRADVRRAGLGDRLANAWRSRVYPEGGASSLSPSVLIYSKAPEIIQGHTAGATIRHREGLWLAIPTRNVPRRGAGRPLTPVEVEAAFNQDLTFVPGRSGRTMLAFVDVVRARSGRGFREPTQRREKAGRRRQLVHMFTLVRQVTLRKRLDWPRIAQDLAGAWGEILADEFDKELGVA